MTQGQPVRVAAVLNDREIALTAGTNAGLQVGDTLRIIDGSGQQVRDPDTGEVLGEIVATKAVVRVYEAQERFSLARTFRSRRVNVGGAGVGAFTKLFEAPRYETRVETLRRDPSKGLPLADPDESLVEVGDIAEKVEGSVDDIPSSTIWR